MPSPPHLFQKMEAPGKSMEDNSSMPFHMVAFREMLSNVPCVLLCSNFIVKNGKSSFTCYQHKELWREETCFEEIVEVSCFDRFLGVVF